MVVLMSAFTGAASVASAQSIIEQLVSPGALTAKHAKYEATCESCHASFDKAAQPRLCLDCHKEVAADYTARRGFHGRLQPANQPCNVCHTDHAGRDKNIVVFEPTRFDHRLTDYPLRDKHVDVECKSCHAVGDLYREAASDCATCHKPDEPHKGNLGTECQSCHNEAAWDEIRFDHSKTDFKIDAAHKGVECVVCHADERYTNLPATCISCHRADDEHKGNLGQRCETCHTGVQWVDVRFDHAKTKFALTGAHARSECEDCHANQRYAIATTCISCHRDEDVHKARLGQNCATCHTANDWDVAKFDHSKTKFTLLGKHVTTRCEDCHVQPSTKLALKTDCLSCHKADDDHKGTFGVACEQCHSANNWTTASFDHTGKTDFRLTGEHRSTACEDCHAPGSPSANIATTCISCHQPDDVHERQLGVNCQQCHNDRGWDIDVAFDHDLSRFPLLGEHGTTKCDECHTSQRYADASVVCVDCHRDDDHHKTALGVVCEDCHNPISWAEWSFDHAVQTKFPLLGAHADTGCADCHLPNQPKVQTTCIGCHRREDVHNGRFGADCARCHTTTSFRVLRNRF
jgi:hypothetical protein